MQQIYRRTPMPKCDFNKVAKHLWTATSGYENMSCEHAQCQELQQNKTIQHNTQGFSYFQSSVVQKFALSQFRNYLPLKNGIKCTHKYNIPISITCIFSNWIYGQLQSLQSKLLEGIVLAQSRCLRERDCFPQN